MPGISRCLGVGRGSGVLFRVQPACPWSAVGLAFQLQQQGAVHEAIQEGHGQRRIAQVIVPSLEVDIGHQGRAAAGIADFDDLVEQIGRQGTVHPFQFLEAEFVDDQQVDAAVVAQPPRQGIIGPRLGQLLDQPGTGGIADPVAEHAQTAADALDQMALTQAALAHLDQVVAAADELAGGQFLEPARSIVAALKFQSKFSSVPLSRKWASWIRRSILRWRRWAA